MLDQSENSKEISISFNLEVMVLSSGDLAMGWICNEWCFLLAEVESLPQLGYHNQLQNIWKN